MFVVFGVVVVDVGGLNFCVYFVVFWVVFVYCEVVGEFVEVVVQLVVVQVGNFEQDELVLFFGIELIGVVGFVGEGWGVQQYCQ